MDINDTLNKNILNEIRKKSKNTKEFCSKSYKKLSKIADKNIEKNNFKYAKDYSELLK